MTSIDSTLQERGERYGSFEHHAKIAQDLQRVLHAEAGWDKLADDQRQALTVVMDKVARMLSGDPAYRDNWHDIVGYAKLVDDRMKRDNLAVFRANEATAPPAPEWPKDEQRIDAIGQNGNGGEHYWHPWHGGDQPVANGQLVDIKLDGEGRYYGIKADNVNWGKGGAVTLWRSSVALV